MKFILEHMGGVLIAVIAGGMLLLLLVTGEHAQIHRVGEVMKEKQQQVQKEEIATHFFVEENRNRITFDYEEQVFEVDKGVNLVTLFQAKDNRGTRLKVSLEEIFPETYRVENGKVVFEKDGIYEVRVSAQGMMYEVCVPVVAYPKAGG